MHIVKCEHCGKAEEVSKTQEKLMMTLALIDELIQGHVKMVGKDVFWASEVGLRCKMAHKIIQEIK